MNGKGLTMTRVNASRAATIVLCLFGLVGCAGPPPLPGGPSLDDGRKAARRGQDREHELATLRAEIAATKIAAAKKEAEVIELRALVTQLRQENGEARQTILEAKRAGEAIEHDLVALRTERDELQQTADRHRADRVQLAALQETVAAVSRELGEVKQAMAAAARATAPTPAAGEKRVPEGKTKRARADEPPAASPVPAAESDRIIPAMHMVRDDVGVPKTPRVTVQPGDTLWGIARRHQTTVEALRAANGLQGDQVLAGKELKLP